MRRNKVISYPTIEKKVIPIDTIIEMGMIRKRNECAFCGKKMDIRDYNIQLCSKCRRKYWRDYSKKLE